MAGMLSTGLKKYLKFMVKNVKIDTKAMGHLFSLLKSLSRFQRRQQQLI